MSVLITIISIIIVGLWFMLIYIAFLRKFSNISIKIIWILLLIFFPISGIVFIFIVDKISEHPDDVQKGYSTLEIITKNKQEAENIIKELQKIPKELIENKMKNIVLENLDHLTFHDSRENTDSALYWNKNNRLGNCTDIIENVQIGEVASIPAFYSNKYYIMYLLDKK